MGIEKLIGKTLKSIEPGKHWRCRDDGLVFTCTDGSVYWMGHYQDCCELVDLVDQPEWHHLVGRPILIAEERVDILKNGDEHTWYHLGTDRSVEVIRWTGYDSYYTTRVAFEEVTHDATS